MCSGAANSARLPDGLYASMERMSADQAVDTFRAMRAILIAGLTCGVLDGFAAFALSGGRWVRVAQFIASGILGPGSFRSGAAAVVLGTLLHFGIALGASAVYFAASRAMPYVLDRALVFGVLYGTAVHLFMTFVVVPLSAIGRRPFVWRGFLVQLAVHMIVVGPTIALMIRRYSR